jgi:hypothetical protein
MMDQVHKEYLPHSFVCSTFPVHPALHVTARGEVFIFIGIKKSFAIGRRLMLLLE